MAVPSAAGSPSYHQEGAGERPSAAPTPRGQGPRGSEALTSTGSTPKTNTCAHSEELLTASMTVFKCVL